MKFDEPTPLGILVPNPPPNKISHVSIKVTDLAKTVDFCEKFGFQTVGNANDGKQFMRRDGSQKHWKPLLLLVEDPKIPPRQNSYSIDQTCLGLHSTDVEKYANVLKSKGLEVSYPKSESGMTKRATCKDPDNFVIHITPYKNGPGFFCRWPKYKKSFEESSAFHWSVNVADSTKVNNMLEHIGFKSMSDQNKNQVDGSLLHAFERKGEDTTAIEHIRLATLPDDHFVLQTLQWAQPEYIKNAQELSNSFSIAVKDAEEALKKAKCAGMTVKEGIKTVTLPYYGEVEIGTV